jgi:hypothetical protein
MNAANAKRQKLLGMPFGTATSRLRKALLFKLAEKAGMLDCHRCGKQIETLDQFSIEHKVTWSSAQDPVAAFFDVDNIAFSHPICNTRAASRPNKIYASQTEAKQVQFARYYARPDKREQVLSRKRNRYHSDKSS